MRNRRGPFHQGCEFLEPRLVFSAMVDFVFLLDESGSQDIGTDGEALRPWVSQIVPQLETKLTERSIGTAPNAPNRYGVVAFGGAARTLHDGELLFTSADRFNTLLTQFDNLGSDEDGWEAIEKAAGVDGFVSEYSFREGAAVQFIMVTDESRQVPTRSGGLTLNGDSLFFQLLHDLQRSDLNSHNDIILTTVSQFAFQELLMFEENEFHDEIPNAEFEPTIMGVDVNVLNSIDLDSNRNELQDDFDAELTDDVLVYVHRTHESIFEADNPEDVEFFVDAWRRSGDSAATTILDPGIRYPMIRSAFQNACDGGSECSVEQYNSEDNQDINIRDESPIVGQDSFHAEEYAFLTWEARGTAWDFGIVVQEFQRWEDPNQYQSLEALMVASQNNFDGLQQSDSLIRSFNHAFIDDIFEKVRLQLFDFDGSGQIGLGFKNDSDQIVAGDFATYLGDAFEFNTRSTLPQDPAFYDLDNDGRFVDLEQGTIDKDDIRIATNVFSTRIGDSNLDFEFTTRDLVFVFQSGEYEDELEDNSTWLTGDWNGDFEFNTNDFVFAFQAGGFQNGLVDRNLDHRFDLLPVWAWDAEDQFSGRERFYRPSWRLPL